jgi:shikimate dehydrogenase
MHAVENCYGFSVTVPYKERVAQALSNRNSCNTLSRQSDGWQAHSTDGPGFIEGMKEIERSPADFAQAIVLGNGGAAKALIDTLLHANLQLSLNVVRRDASKDKDWPIDPRIHFHDFQTLQLKELIQDFPKALVIQSTSAPLKGDDLASFLPALDSFRGTFVDLVYGKPSALYKACKERGLPAQDGLPMLMHQALLAQDIWWGQRAPTAVIREALAPYAEA